MIIFLRGGASCPVFVSPGREGAKNGDYEEAWELLHGLKLGTVVRIQACAENVAGAGEVNGFNTE
jgi:hypothetical protein